MGVPQLLEPDRKRLDGIVSQMVANGETDDDIQFVVNDFKTKYAPKPKVKKQTVQQPTNVGALMGALAGMKPALKPLPSKKIDANQARANQLAKLTGRTVAPATTVTGVKNPKPKAASGMDIANMANELQERMSKALKPADPPDWLPDPLLGALNLIPGVKEVTKPSNLIPGAVLSPIDIAGDIAVFGDTNSTREQQLGALANIFIKTPLAVTGGGLALKGASKGVQLAITKAQKVGSQRAMLAALKAAEKEGADLGQFANQIAPPKVETPSGLPPNLQPKPAAKPVVEAKGGTAEVTPIKTEDITPTPHSKGKPIRVYRGSNLSEDPKAANLTGTRSIHEVLGKEKPAGPEPLNVTWYTETPKHARSYAQQDLDLLQMLKRSRGPGDPPAEHSFKVLTGRDAPSPNAVGKMESFEVNPNKVLDLSDLGPQADPDAMIFKLMEAEGSPIPGKDSGPEAWARYHEIWEKYVGFADDGDAGPVTPYRLLRNDEPGIHGPGDSHNHGTHFVEWAKANGYDAIRLREGDGTHVVILDPDNARISPVQQLRQAATPPTPPKGAKEPWEMTREEYAGQQDKMRMSPYDEFAGHKTPSWRTEDLNKGFAYHKWGVVEQALKEGKPVPAEVLADYPDLAAKYGGKPTVKENLTVPKAEVPKVEEPKVDAPEPSGLSRSSRAVLADVYGTNKPTSIGGKSLDELYESGRKKLNEGFDAEAEMDALAQAGRPATDEEIGAFSVYRDDLIGQLDVIERRMKGGGDDVADERLKLFEKIAAFDRNLDEVKAAGGRSLNALKIGHKVAWDDLNEVLVEAKRYKPVSAGREKEFRILTEKQKSADARITNLETELAKVKTEGIKPAPGERGAATRKRAVQDRVSIHKEIDEILKSAAKTNDIGSAAYDAARFAGAAGRLAITYVKEGIGTIDEAVAKAIADFAERGITVDPQQVYDDIGGLTVHRTRSEIQAELAKLRGQAKRESTANKAKIQSDIEGLQEQLNTGNFRTPTKRELVISKQLEDLRAEKQLYAAKVQAAIRAHAAPMGKKIAKEASGLIRGTILGSDIGVLTRQGLFGLSRPGAFVKGVGKGLKAAVSEKNLVKIENDIVSHKVDGQTAGVVYNKAGLSLSSYLSNPEELVIGHIAKNLPLGIGKLVGTLGRFQTAFINTLRSETMDRAIRLGYKDNELAARANFINSATGRSNIKNVPTALEVILTSPRYEASRWEMLAQPLRNATALAKDAVTGKGLNRGAVANIQDMAVTAAEIYGLYKLTEASGYSVDWDPTSSDFLKMRKGDEVWDPSAGLAPRIRDAMRFVVWGMEPKYQENALKVLGQTVVRPISPAIRQPIEAGSQAVQRARGVPEDKLASFFTGWKIDEDEKGWITFAPLIMQTAKKYLDEGDYEGATSAAFREWIGQSVNKYPAPKK